MAIVQSGDVPVIKQGIVIVRIQKNPQQQQGGSQSHNGKHGSDSEQSLQVPLLGGLRRDNIVITNRNQGTIIQHSNQHKHQHRHVEIIRPGLHARWQWVRLVIDRFKHKGSQKEKHQQLQSSRNSVSDKVFDTTKNTARNLQTQDDSGETWLGQHNISSSSSGIGGTLHSNTNISSL